MPYTSVLIVHSIQTLLVVLLGIYAWLSLSFTVKRGPIQPVRSARQAEQEEY